jgi:hypothetical protein
VSRNPVCKSARRALRCAGRRKCRTYNTSGGVGDLCRTPVQVNSIAFCNRKLFVWSLSPYVPWITKTTSDHSTQLYFIGTALHVSDHAIHHQVQTDLTLADQCKSYCSFIITCGIQRYKINVTIIFFWRSWNRASLMYSFKYNQQEAALYNILYYCQCSTCFRRFLCPSSGAENCTHSMWYMSSLLAATASSKEYCITLHLVGYT